MKNIIFLLLLVFTTFLAIYFYRQYSNTQQKLELANRQVLDRDTMIYQLQKKVTQNITPPVITDTAVIASPSNLGQLSPTEISRLRSKGLRSPEVDLKADLTANQRQILQQQNDTLGGTMAIRDIQILNERYALAYFEDGHVGGYLILRFQVQSGGQISWEVLDAYRI